MTHPATSGTPPDFSLVRGGLLFQCLRRAGLSGESLELLNRRLLAILCLTWVPLLVLSAVKGHALGSGIRIPFLHDIEAQVRFLIALPILIAAELIVHQRIRPAVQYFVDREIVIPEELPKFRAAIEATARLRNSPIVEGVLLVLVYTLGFWVWRSQVVLEGASWYASGGGAQSKFTPAGLWYAFVSVPIFQFVLLRWYLRLLLWFGFLWRISRLNLRLIPAHPDRSAGLGFLGKSSYAFGPILFAQGAMLAGVIGTQVFHAGQHLMSFKMEVAAFLIFYVAVVLGPLAVFTPHLMRVKRKGACDFDMLASQYTRKFEEKWLLGGGSANHELLGTADIQSLSALENSYSVIQQIRFVPFGWKDVTRLAATVLVPLLPLALTVFSVEEMLTEVIKFLF